MYYSNNIPNNYYNMYNTGNYMSSGIRQYNPVGRRLGGGFVLPFALGFLSAPLVYRPRPYYNPYPYYNYPIYY